MSNSNSKIMIGFLAGAAAGVLAGILFAPDKGKETRKKISRKTGDVADSLKHKFNDVVDGLKESYSSTKSELEDVAEKGNLKLNALKNEAMNALHS